MRLLVFDVEGTLFKTTVRLEGTSINSTVWQALALSLGADAVREEVQTHQKWANGQYNSYLEWMKETIEIHQRFGLTESLFHNVIGAAEYNPGVTDLFRSIDRKHYEIVLISGGFRELTLRAQKDLCIHHIFAACEYLFSDTGRLSSYNLLPCDFAGKFDFIQLMLREYKLTSTDWLFVGDGLNDVEIAKRAPVSIGYCPHPDLAKVVTHVVSNFLDIKAFL